MLIKLTNEQIREMRADLDSMESGLTVGVVISERELASLDEIRKLAGLSRSSVGRLAIIRLIQSFAQPENA